MNNDDIMRMQNDLKQRTGRKYSFQRLEECIRQSDYPDVMIMHFATLLKPEYPDENPLIGILRKKFLTKYRSRIAVINGLADTTAAAGALWQHYPIAPRNIPAFIEGIARMYNQQVFAATDSPYYVAHWLQECVQTDMQARSVYNNMLKFKDL